MHEGYGEESRTTRPRWGREIDMSLAQYMRFQRQRRVAGRQPLGPSDLYNMALAERRAELASANAARALDLSS